MIELNKYRIGTGVPMLVRLYDSGASISWPDVQIRQLCLYNEQQRAFAGYCTDIAPDAEDDTLLHCLYPAEQQLFTGVYRLIAQVAYNGNPATYDALAFVLVRNLDEAGAGTNPEPVEIGITVSALPSSVITEVLDACIKATADAEHAAHLVPLQILQDCEAATQAALEAAGKAPYIGENGNWFVWDAEAGEYVDSGNQARGSTGNGIASWTVVESQEDGGYNVVTVTFTDGTEETFNIKNGSKGDTGNGIASIVQTVESPDDAGTNVITVTMTDGTVVTFNVKNGSKGTPGVANAAYKSVSSLPPASAETMGYIYLTPTATSGVYDMSYTEFDGSAYSWEPLGTTAIQMSDYATKSEVRELSEQIQELSGKFYGFHAASSSLPGDADVPGYAYVGRTAPFAIWNFDGETWSDSGSVMDGASGYQHSVKYTEQSLTTGEKRQARKNIGAVEYVENGVADEDFEPAEYVTRDEMKDVVFCPPGDETDIDNEDIAPYILTGKYIAANGSLSNGVNYDIVVMPLPTGYDFISFEGLDDFYPIAQLNVPYEVAFWSGDAATNTTFIMKSNVVVPDDGKTDIIKIPNGATRVGFYVANRTSGLVYDVSDDVSLAISKIGGMEDRFGNPLVADEVSEDDERPVKSKAVARALANIATAITPEYPSLPDIEPAIAWTSGYYLNSNGVATASQYCAVSGYIPVPRGAFALRMNVMKGGVAAVAAWIGYTEESEASAITGEMCFDTTAGDAYTDEVLLPILPGVPFIRISRWADTHVDDDPVISFVTLADSRDVTPGMVQLQGRGKTGVPEVGFLPLAKVEIESELLTPNATNNTISPLTTSKNEVGVDGNGDIDGTVTVRLTMGGEVVEDDISIAYQGNSTLTDPKKGLSIDTANKHRIGEWIEFDSFHLKAYWTDWMHARDLVGNKLLEQIYLSRSMETRRPFMTANNFDPSDDRLNSDTGVRCHIDGFPVELYINGTYWGLYSWNVKKDRNNYALSKNDNQHIMVECGYDGAVNPSTGDIVWTSCEFRNPKTVKNADGTKYDGDNPQEIQDGDVKKSWVRFCTFLHSITAATTKAEVAQYIDIEDFVDYTVLADALLNSDTFRNNILWTCWDATVESDVAVSGRWHPLTYDMDLTFGKSKVFGSMYNKFFTHPWSVDVWSLWANAKTPEMVLLRQIFADEIAARYRELRACGILSAVNIMNLFDSWTNAVGYDALKREHTRWPSATERPIDSTMRCVATVASRLIALDTKYNFSK